MTDKTTSTVFMGNEYKVSYIGTNSEYAMIQKTMGFSIGATTSENYLNNNYVEYTLGQTKSTITNEKYSVMDLKKDVCPMAVFVNGKMLTLGILGTNVECAYTGSQLVFKTSNIIATQYSKYITVSIEYEDEICHYNIESSLGWPNYKNKTSSTLRAALVSSIKKDGNY